MEIAARPMFERKTSANLQTVMQEICTEWKVDVNRVRGVVTDGGANIKAAVRALFGADKHIECAAHLLNSIGQAALGLQESKRPSEEEPEDILEIPENEEEAIDFLDDLLEETDDSQGILFSFLFFRAHAIASLGSK